MRMILKSALALLPLAILASCAADDPVIDKNDGNIAEKSEMRYLKVALKNPVEAQGTRVGQDDEFDYDGGTSAENKISTLDFYFYKPDKDFHSYVSVPIAAEGGVDPTTENVAEHVYGFYSTNVPVKLVQGEAMPAYVICIINAVNPSEYQDMPMTDAQKAILTDFKGSKSTDNTVYLGMNNSVYYGTDADGNQKTLIMATPFSTDKLLTKTDLEKWESDDQYADELEAATIDIYVERYCAKVNFSLDQEVIQDYTSGNDITLTFNPVNWHMNAFEKESYFLKAYRKSSGNDLSFFTEDECDALLFPGWNKPEQFRSFWSCTPGYYENDYPLVADDILDAKASGAEYPYKVHYTTYDSENAQPLSNGSRYVMETTLKGSRLTGVGMPDQYLPLTSIPSVVVTGYYTIGDDRKTFYTYLKGNDGKPNVYSAAPGDIAGVKDIKDVMLKNQTIVLQKVNDKYIPVDTDNPGGTQFTVEHPSKAVRSNGEIKLGGDMVTLTMKATDSGYYFYDSSSTEGHVLITDENLDKVNRLLLQNLGCAHAYKDGKAFFSAPIQHWGWYREGNPNYGKPMNEWDWSLMQTGDFGIVRNHVYNLKISRISGLGTGIINDSDPLLPPTEKVGYSVHFHVNIQKWAVLPEQEWEW